MEAAKNRNHVEIVKLLEADLATTGELKQFVGIKTFDCMICAIVTNEDFK